MKLKLVNFQVVLDGMYMSRVQKKSQVNFDFYGKKYVWRWQ